MFGLPLIDVIVIIIYFIAVLWIGIWSMRRIKNQSDFFLAGRRTGKILQTFAAFGQATSAETAVGVTTTTFTNGAGGIWSTLNMLFATPMYWITSPWLRRLRVMTMGDFFEDRYGSKRIAALYAVIGSFCMIINIGTGLNAMGKTIIACTPKNVEQLTLAEQQEFARANELEKLQKASYASLTAEQKERLNHLQFESPRRIFSHLDEKAVIWITALTVMFYIMIGGLEAAFLTDLLQGVFIIVLSVVLLPFAWHKLNLMNNSSGFLGGFQALHQNLPNSYFDIFGSPVSVDFTWYYIVCMSIMVTINVVVVPNMVVVTGAAKDELSARIGFTTGNYMKRWCTLLWGLLGLAAFALYSNVISNSDMVWGYTTHDLLGSLGLGLVGLIIASLMAALMSTASCLMITASSLIIRNLYRPLRPDRSEGHYLLIGRIVGAAILLGGAYMATSYDSIFALMKLGMEFNVVVAASFWLGIKWRRATRVAAWTSILSTLILFTLAPSILPAVFTGLRTHPYLLKTTNPQPIEREFIAKRADVKFRDMEISRWQTLNADEQKTTAKPEPLREGENFIKVDKLPKRSIFWTQGLKVEADGTAYGRGMLNLELILAEKMGFDLAQNSYALNETLRVIVRTVTPFLILFLISFMTRPEDKKRLDRFFVKMKTPALPDAAVDAAELEISYQNPHRFDHVKLFPHSNWEFYKWNKVDVLGFLGAVAMALAVIIALKLMVSIGG